MQKISIIVPCFNEEVVLPKLFMRLDAVAVAWGTDYEILCIDDGSRDRTWELLKNKNAADARWRCLSFARNFGHQTAVSAGLFYAAGDAVVVIDADLQDPPEEIVHFLEKWRQGYDVVYGVRQKRKENFPMRFCYWFFYRLMAGIAAFEVPLDSGDFCLMDRRVVDTIKLMPERNRFVRGLRAWAGFKQIGVPYERQARAAGEPKYDFRKLFKLAWDGLFSFSTMPLVLVTYLGLFISTIAGLGAIFTLAQRLFSNWFQKIGLAPVPGFATIVISVLFLGGVQLLCLGILGEYIGRIYEEVKRRPMWVVREQCGIPAEPARADHLD